MNRLYIKGLLLSPCLLGLIAIDLYAQNFVYINDNVSGSNTVSAFSVAEDGALSPIAGSPFSTGGFGGGDFLFAADRATVCAVASRLYVSNSGSNNVSGFDVDSMTGALIPVPGSPFATGGAAGGGISLECTPDGQFVIATNGGSSSVTVFSVAANGVLTPVSGSPFPLGGTPAGLKVSPDGRFLSVAILNLDRVAMFSIASNGSLAPVPGSPFVSPASGAAAGVEINCASSILYATQATPIGTNVDVFRIGADGVLTLVQTSNNTVGNNSNAALLSANNQFLFVSNQGSNTITVFSAAADGALSLVAGSPFANPGGATPQQLATNQPGTLLYANNSNGMASVFGIANNGVLTPVAGSPFAVGSGARPGISAFPPAGCCSLTCPPDVTTCNDPGQSGAIVTFEPTTGNCATVSCDPPSGSVFPIGTTTVTCVSGTGQSCSFDVTVEDCGGPVLSCAVATPVLWTPNHKLVNVGLSVNADGSSTDVGPVQVMVFGDEDDDEPTGDGKHSPDASDMAPGALRLRSERNGNGDGRVYLIVVRATDARGNVGFCCSTVVVPHDRSRGALAAVQSQAAAARAFAESNGGAPPPGYLVIGDGPIIGPKK